MDPRRAAFTKSHALSPALSPQSTSTTTSPGDTHKAKLLLVQHVIEHMQEAIKTCSERVAFLKSAGCSDNQQTHNAPISTLPHVDALSMIKQLDEEEMLRRQLRNQTQDRKGNIRVFCRVRPVLQHDSIPQVVGGSCRSGSLEDAEDRSAFTDFTYPDEENHRKLVVSTTTTTSGSVEGKRRSTTTTTSGSVGGNRKSTTTTTSGSVGGKRKSTTTTSGSVGGKRQSTTTTTSGSEGGQSNTSFEFTFDRVFEPQATQADLYEEISQLVQSCVDGYNVCIFAYGQSGSGKSFTMEGGPTEATMGMIPRAVEDVFRAAVALKSSGWEYKMEGQFLEIYNEKLYDLLPNHGRGPKKEEINREVTKCFLPLESPQEVTTCLQLANSRRMVATTPMNARSSRSHFVFTLHVSGYNAATERRCEACLNLVDLAGSENLHSGSADGLEDRRIESKSINLSLSALRDVILALRTPRAKASSKHVPFRNSLLTYLLRNSMSGNSKTLMILHLSPLSAHLSQSLASLRFGTEVNNTIIGVAKKQLS